MNDYLTLGKHLQIENIVKKSRFIANCFPVLSEKEAEEYIKEIKKVHYKATHNTFAYVIGVNKDVQRFSDDGEPSGTAGKPILEAINNKDLTSVLIIVTRYFGGIKLGASGLIRAYNGTTVIALDKAKKVLKQFCTLLQIKINYHYLGKVQTYINTMNIYLKDIIYEDNVMIEVYIAKGMVNNCIKEINDITNNKFTYKIIKEKYIDIELN